jgi:hypothetical protein
MLRSKYSMMLVCTVILLLASFVSFSGDSTPALALEGNSGHITFPGGPEPGEEICFNDAECEAKYVGEYTKYYEQLYPGAEVIVMVMPSDMGFGICSGQLCTSYWDITIEVDRIDPPLHKTFYVRHKKCQTWDPFECGWPDNPGT